MTKLGIIVLNYNDCENTLRLCKEYEKMKIVNKIIIVDNQSPDHPMEKLMKLKSKKIDVLETKENKGYAAGNNFGIHYLNDHYGEFDYIAISNPDISISEKAIETCIDYLNKHKNIAICAPKMLMRNGKEHPISGWKLRSIKGDIHDSSALLTRIINKPHIEMYDSEYMQKDEIVVDCVAGSFFIIRNDIFKKIGYFDENTFLYCEEDILGNKINKLGYKNVILNKINFTHFESVSVDKSMNFIKKYMRLQKSKIYYHKTYNEDANFFTLFLLRFFTYARYINNYLSKVLKCINNFILKLYKAFILVLIMLIHPIIHKCRKEKKVLYYSVVNWKWIKQRPHFVPLYLSQNGYKVDYLYEEPYKKYIKEDIKNTLVQNEDRNTNLKIKTYKYFPYHLIKSIFNRYIFTTRSLFMCYDKIVFTNPHQITNMFVRALQKSGTKIYYECMDNYIYWENDDTIELFNLKEKWLMNYADKIIVSSEGLKNLLLNKYNCDKSKIALIRNGYDKTIFEKMQKSPIKMKHPNATYIGTIDEWFDFKSIIEYATKHKDIYFYIIGPIGESVKDKVKKIKKENIIFCKPIEHKYVPNTIENSDIMLLPFKVNSLIETVDPVKVYEYLYMKKATVSSYWKELDQFKNFVTFYTNEKDFEKAIKKALKTKIDTSDEYKKLMKNSAWEVRLKKYLDAIK